MATKKGGKKSAAKKGGAKKAAKALERLHAGFRLHAYYARVNGGQVIFEAVESGT